MGIGDNRGEFRGGHQGTENPLRMQAQLMQTALDSADRVFEKESTRFSTYRDNLDFLEEILVAWRGTLPLSTIIFVSLEPDKRRLFEIMKEKFTFLERAVEIEIAQVNNHVKLHLGPAELREMRQRMSDRVKDFKASIQAIEQYLPE